MQPECAPKLGVSVHVAPLLCPAAMINHGPTDNRQIRPADVMNHVPTGNSLLGLAQNVELHFSLLFGTNRPVAGGGAR